jgi:threonine synthase
MKLYGSKVVKVPGKRQDANEAAVKAAETGFYASHLWQPYFIMGLQSAAFEIWENMNRTTPARVIVPVGSGGLLEGLFLGFGSLVEAGYAGDIPKLIGVQASRCAPIHTAFLGDMNDYADIETRKTVAEGIAVQKPPRAGAVLSALRKSGGYTVTVEEEEIIEAARKLSEMGLFVEPTSASTLAAWLKIESTDREDAVLILTGSGLKAISTYATQK